MTGPIRDARLKVFATCPASYTAARDTYLAQVVDAARWSEAAGCEGILVYTDNGLVDPWVVSQVILTHTERLCPLVAVQPVYMHPYAVAKIVASFGFLYGRRLYLNMVAGGFKHDLNALNDPTPHDERYTRLVEYTSVILKLLSTRGTMSYQGRYYTLTNIRLAPPLAPELLPGVFVSGSSEAGLHAARELGATAVQYPKPVSEYETTPPVGVESLGIRIGVIAREDRGEAWAVARAAFPEDRPGQLTRQLATKVSDSEWHAQLSRLGQHGIEDSPYWMVPFDNYKTNCPYLVGSYDGVADEIGRYMEVGYRTLILDIPASSEELRHIGVALERAAARVAP